MFCEKCGAENPDDATFCGSCGHRFQIREVKEKNMVLALVISFLLTGLGIVYAGNLKKGLILFLAGIVFSILGIGLGIFTVIAVLIWAYALYSTYNEVRLANGVKNPNLFEDWKGWDTSKKAVTAVVAIVVLLILIGSVFSAVMPKPSYTDFDDYDSDSSNINLGDSNSYSSGGSSYSSSSNGRDVSSHYEGDSGSADTYGTVYDDGSVESHQTGHTDYGDYQIDSYMDSNGNLHGTVDMGGHTYHVSSS